MNNRLFLSFLFVLFTSCTLAPERPEPEMPVEKSFISENKGQNKTLRKQLKGFNWKNFYKDRLLKKLISKSLRNNRQYLSRVLDTLELEEQYDIQKSELFPNLDLQGEMRRQKIPGNALGQGGLFGSAGGGQPTGFIQNQYNLSVGLTSYEIDFFGKIRSLKRAVLHEYLASHDVQASQRIALIADVSSEYLNYMTNLELQRLAEETVSLQSQVVGIIEKRWKQKVVSEIELRQAETLLENLKTDVLERKRLAAINKQNLSVLVGEPLTELPKPQSLEDSTKLTRNLPENLSSMVLLARPDIRQAEHQLLAENARIGAARAAFFPSIQLTTRAGWSSTQLDNLFEERSQSWSFIPRVNLPIFTWGQNMSRLEVSKIRKKKSILNYEYSIQEAFREVASGLISKKNYKKQINAQQRVVKAAQKTSELSDLRYRSGVDSYLVSLDSRRSLYEAQTKYIQIKQSYIRNNIFLFKALGGGEVGVVHR